MLIRELRERDNLVAIAVAFVTVLSLALRGAGGPAQGPGVPATFVGALLLVLFLVPAVQVRLRRAVEARPGLDVWIPVGIATYGAVAMLVLGSPKWFNVAAWPLCVGAALLAVGDRREGELSAGRFLAAGVALWILAGIWDRAVQIRVMGDGRYGLPYLTSIALGIFLFTVARPRRSFDLRLGLTLRELGIALSALAVTAAVAIPVGVLIGFVHWEPRWQGWAYAAARIFGLFLFVGIPEELLFRGVYQEAFSRFWTPRIGWIVGSVFFGVSHIVKHFPPLNWQYALLATVAGLAYGWVYQRTGKLAAAAVTHAAVDWLWSTWLGS